MAQRFRSFVALGDSFTEGMNDRRPDGGFRGWADLTAERLADEDPQFRYANLAVRGRLFDAIVDDQVPEALRLRPELVSLAAGGNDVLRPNFHPARMATRLHEAVRVLSASGAHVLLITASTVSDRLPVAGVLRHRFLALNDLIRRVAARHDATVVDLWPDETFHDNRLWSEDRLHMSSVGHRRVAGHVCRELGVAFDPAWLAAPDSAGPAAGWLSRRRDDAAWMRRHLAPWVQRRLTGRSSGDTVTAKRPRLAPIRSEGA